MDIDKLKRIASKVAVVGVTLIAETLRERFVNTNQAAVLEQKRLARKELIESDAFKNALPYAQERMLRSLEY